MDDSSNIAITEELQIPASELQFRFSPSRGPGGQHVNRAHTRVTLLFNVSGSAALDEPTREKLLQALAARLDSQGILHLTVQDTRSQSKNRQLAIARFVSLLSEALEEQPQRIATKPPAAADERRLEEKKKKSERKRERSRDWSADA
jgi:ribosome-associated protein